MKKKVLFVLSRFPYPLTKGDKVRAYHQIRKLSESCDVYLVALSDVHVSKKSIAALDPYCKEIHAFRLYYWTIIFSVCKFFLFTDKPAQVGYFFNKRIFEKICHTISVIQPDHIFCQLIRTSEYVRKISGIPKTLDYMDALSAGMERREKYAPKLTRFLFKTEASRLRKYEHNICKSFDSCCIISEFDRELIFRSENKDITVLPNGIDADYFHDLHRKIKYDLLFTGNMSYPPNVQSARYLVENIMPLIWEKRPDTSLLISGDNPEKSILKCKSDKVNIEGWIDDIRESYSSSLIFIAPMLMGSGIQNKLLEAMAMNLPCITSKLANRALNAEEGSEILVGNNDKEYAEHIYTLLENEQIRIQIAKKGRKFVTDHFEWSTSNQILLNILNNSNVESPS
ncbi:MAG: glycosyltransferase [Halieaceae bacterium]|jgi:polysaccharide biosynthesis protein PslH|nr:glycosyltransferase [Halieaceae bacterium]